MALDTVAVTAILPPMKIALILFITGLMLGFAMPANAAALYEIPLKDIDGKATSLKAYEGKVLLIVNVASKCGYTKQYTPLEAVYDKYKDQGFVVLAFPCNDFGGQEPGTNEQIKEFCSSTYDVSFPLFDKIHVKPGADQSPLYATLTGADAAFPGPISWNFNKFLVSKDGTVIARFESKDSPDSEKVTVAIETALKSQ